jgi:hypothetical protein
MYKKFLVLMLLTAVLVGCSHQSSDKQTGDQADAALPVQDQIVNQIPSNGGEQAQQPPSSSSAEPTQMPLAPPAENSGATPPVTGSDGTMPAAPLAPPTIDNPDMSSTATPPVTDNKDASHSGSTGEE